jgi:hypothetical protein
MYLCDRVPLPYNYNPFLQLIDDSRASDACVRAASLVESTLRFYTALRVSCCCLVYVRVYAALRVSCCGLVYVRVCVMTASVESTLGFSE